MGMNFVQGFTPGQAREKSDRNRCRIQSPGRPPGGGCLAHPYFPDKETGSERVGCSPMFRHHICTSDQGPRSDLLEGKLGRRGRSR